MIWIKIVVFTILVEIFSMKSCIKQFSKLDFENDLKSLRNINFFGKRIQNFWKRKLHSLITFWYTLLFHLGDVLLGKEFENETNVCWYFYETIFTISVKSCAPNNKKMYFERIFWK